MTGDDWGILMGSMLPYNIAAPWIQWVWETMRNSWRQCFHIWEISLETKGTVNGLDNSHEPMVFGNHRTTNNRDILCDKPEQTMVAHVPEWGFYSVGTLALQVDCIRTCHNYLMPLKTYITTCNEKACANVKSAPV